MLLDVLNSSSPKIIAVIIGAWELLDLRVGGLWNGDLLAMPECIKKTFTTPTSNETALIPKVAY